MKSIKLFVGMVAAVALAFGGFTAAHADSNAQFLFTPATQSVRAGQTVSVYVTIDPYNQAVYTGKIHLAYPAALLEVTGWTYGNTVMPLSQPGYDTVDNSGGNLIKTAGIPGGISSPVLLGIVTFKAKQAGQATIVAQADSMVLNASSSNALSSEIARYSPVIAITAAKTAAASSGTSANSTTSTGSSLTAGSSGNLNTATGTTTLEGSTTPNGLPNTGGDQSASAIGSSISSSVAKGLLVGIIALLVLIGLVYALARRA